MRLAKSLILSAFIHAAVLAVLIVAVRGHASAPITPTTEPRRIQLVLIPSHIVFLPSTGAGGGGGGGGNRQSGPIRRAESAGHDAITLRIRKPTVPSVQRVDAEVPAALPALVLDARPMASGIAEQIGLPDRGVTFGTSQGPGSGGGVGDGVGTGIGSGRGPGLGPGSGGGVGGGVYRPGGAVTTPQLLSLVRPRYTADALARRAQGSVTLELIVNAQGAATAIHVVRSLDRDLDEEAIKAVREWRFSPGRLSGTPVDVLVNVIVDFTIR